MGYKDLFQMASPTTQIPVTSMKTKRGHFLN